MKKYEMIVKQIKEDMNRYDDEKLRCLDRTDITDHQMEIQYFMYEGMGTALATLLAEIQFELKMNINTSLSEE